MSGGGSRASIPSSVRKTIDNIKEITGNHSDDEIYSMLKECSMDPNETAQKLLLQGTFFFLSFFLLLLVFFSFGFLLVCSFNRCDPTSGVAFSVLWVLWSLSTSCLWGSWISAPVSCSSGISSLH